MRRPVYKKTYNYRGNDFEYFIYYTSKRTKTCKLKKSRGSEQTVNFFQLPGLISEFLTDNDVDIFSAEGRNWIVSKDITSEEGWMRTNQTGLQAIPTTGWLYSDGEKMVGDDDTLTFKYN